MGSLPQNITQDRLTQQDITRKMSWVMVMGLFDLMAESGPGDENIDEIAVERDENIINNLFNETVCQTISKKQNKKIRNYTNHNPVVHLGRNVVNQYQQHQYGFKGSIVQFEQADSCFFDQEYKEMRNKNNEACMKYSQRLNRTKKA